MAILYDVTVADGKYRFVYHDDGKTPMAYRYGEPWDAQTRDMVGHGSLMALVAEISDLREKLPVAEPEISSEHPRFSPIVGVVAKVEVPLERVVNAIIGALEGCHSPWMHSFKPSDTPATVVALDASKDPAEPMIWYSRETFWRAGGQARVVFDRDTDDEGDGGGSTTVGYLDFVRGLSLMGGKSPRHFADLVNENDDAITHDVFMQYVIFGEIIYG